jgi:hypothetical protein
MQADSAAWRIGRIAISEHGGTPLQFQGGDWLRITRETPLASVQLIPALPKPQITGPLSPRTPLDSTPKVPARSRFAEAAAALAATAPPPSLHMHPRQEAEDEWGQVCCSERSCPWEPSAHVCLLALWMLVLSWLSLQSSFLLQVIVDWFDRPAVHSVRGQHTHALLCSSTFSLQPASSQRQCDKRTRFH